MPAASSGGRRVDRAKKTYIDTGAERVIAYRQANALPETSAVPIDAVTASGSGLDPDISVANARLQVARIAPTRQMDPADVQAFVDQKTSSQTLGFLGERGINVVKLNLALDDAS
jgi:K+-transporting ATPase ATPase C chain